MAGGSKTTCLPPHLLPHFTFDSHCTHAGRRSLSLSQVPRSSPAPNTPAIAGSIDGGLELVGRSFRARPADCPRAPHRIPRGANGDLYAPSRSPELRLYGDRLWPALVELSSSVRPAVPDMPSRPRMTHRYVSVNMPLGASAPSPTFHGPSALAIQRMMRQNAAEQWTERVFIITDLPAGTVLSHRRLQLDWLQLTSRAPLTHVHW